MRIFYQTHAFMHVFFFFEKKKRKEKSHGTTLLGLLF